MGFLSTTFTKAALILLIALTIIGSLGLYFYIRVPNMSIECGQSRLYSHSLHIGPYI
uniref:Uncharacterized protein n=1 Tax=Amphimedon queenslandica TaxID=400682 RepID=A0A1X7SQK9_AMPQE